MTDTSKHRDWIAAARTLNEALPNLQRYDGATIVVKFGGNAMGDDTEMASFARDIVLLRQIGVNPVVVHGGGPMINDMAERLGIESTFVDGRRVTDQAMLEVVEMVLSGLVNKRIVQAINDAGGRGAGLSGKDARLMECDLLDAALGAVGVPAKMDAGILRTLMADEIIPVVAPLGFGADGQTLNVNGDTAAGALAAALKADRLLLLTDVSGVKNAEGEVQSELTPKEVEALIADGSIQGGMIPKVSTALTAIEDGVRAVVILDGRAPNACLLELFTEDGAGTLIRPAR